jgi:hypothetical protein
MTNQLILPSDVLRVAGAVLDGPHLPLATQIAEARDPDGGGTLSGADACMVLVLMKKAQGDPSAVVAPDVLAGAIREYQAAMARMTCLPRSVSVHVWDEQRDGPEPRLTARRDHALPAGARWL